MVSTYGGDRELAQQAEQLTNKWFEDHRAISPDLTGSVLATAAYYGDKALFERFLAEHTKTQDRQVRQRILGAMGAFRDRAAIEAAMNAVLSGGIPFIEGAALLFAGQGEAATREMPFDFLRAHYDEIVAKRPSGGGVDFGARLPSVGRSYCNKESRTNLANFFESRISKFVGGPRSFSNVLEEVDLCIAQKAAQEPSVVEFLRKY
jgi:alanyl aminopeptidase